MPTKTNDYEYTSYSLFAVSYHSLVSFTHFDDSLLQFKGHSKASPTKRDVTKLDFNTAKNDRDDVSVWLSPFVSASGASLGARSRHCH